MMNKTRAESETGISSSPSKKPLVICFSHLRWDFVFQRPQHLMTRLAKSYRVVFWEKPKEVAGLREPHLSLRPCPRSGVTLASPEIPAGLDQHGTDAALRVLLDGVQANRDGKLLLWYYTPVMLSFSQHLEADCIVYDCMDELTNFKFAAPDLRAREAQLLQTADLVFTGGYSLYEAKRDLHPSVHPFPSSVEREHFIVARAAVEEPEDQRALPRPRLGFYGVVDERMDLGLLAQLADARPDWSIVIVGPVVNICEADLPQRDNLHYLGAKPYGELPTYLAGWDVALMPFAINEASRFISPTKTPECLSAGKPVVSTAITDVVRQYGATEGVKIAKTAEGFITACDEAMALARGDSAWLEQADEFLLQTDWGDTVGRMQELIEAQLLTDRALHPVVSPTTWPSQAPTAYDVMVIGAGFAGSVMAERLATQLNKRVLVVDRRPHIAGNAYDRLDEAGLLIHQYGPHIFHTNSPDIFDYLSQFTEWRPYEHRVLAQVDGMLVPIPINRTTINALYGLNLTTDSQAEAFLAARAKPVQVVETSEDVVVSAVGRELYEKFFRGYTRKQWGLDPSQLDKAVTSRVPTRTNTDDRYFNDRFQAMPAQGYTRMFERMLDHPNIDLLLGTDYAQVRSAYPHAHLVFTGPIDEYFGYRFGKLPYRSLRFEHETLDTPWSQPVAVVNYPDYETPYTRITEYKHLTGQEHTRTSITYEYPEAEGDPYYPVPRPENQVLYKRYEALADAMPDTWFAGRLATYRYLNMDQVVGQALATFQRIDATLPRTSRVLKDTAEAAD